MRHRHRKIGQTVLKAAWGNEILDYLVAKHSLCTKFGQKFGLLRATKIDKFHSLVLNFREKNRCPFSKNPTTNPQSNANICLPDINFCPCPFLGHFMLKTPDCERFLVSWAQAVNALLPPQMLVNTGDRTKSNLQDKKMETLGETPHDEFLAIWCELGPKI